MEDKKSVCLNLKCGKELTHFEGRRKKKFCSSTCKSLVWYSENKEKAKLYRDNKKMDGKKTNLMEFDEVGQFKKSEVKKILQPINKKLNNNCPENLKGIDRSIWLAENGG